MKLRETNTPLYGHRVKRFSVLIRLNFQDVKLGYFCRRATQLENNDVQGSDNFKL